MPDIPEQSQTPEHLLAVPLAGELRIGKCLIRASRLSIVADGSRVHLWIEAPNGVVPLVCSAELIDRHGGRVSALSIGQASVEAGHYEVEAAFRGEIRRADKPVLRLELGSLGPSGQIESLRDGVGMLPLWY
jgi:hypothetical protein